MNDKLTAVSGFSVQVSALTPDTRTLLSFDFGLEILK
jgi:hypothetical protein